MHEEGVALPQRVVPRHDLELAVGLVVVVVVVVVAVVAVVVLAMVLACGPTKLTDGMLLIEPSN